MAKNAYRICPRCHGWSGPEVCAFCPYVFVGCHRCEGRTDGACPWCKRNCTPTQMELF